MGRILEKAAKSMSCDFIQEIAKELDEIKQQRDVEEAEYKREELIKKLDHIIEKLERKCSGYTGKAWDFKQEKKRDRFAEDSQILLRPMGAMDLDDYIKTKRYYEIVRISSEEDETYRKIMQEEYMNEKSLYCAIIRKEDGEFLGYCAIKDTARNLWELAMELLPEYCGRGYGYRALVLFCKRVSEITKKTQFQSRVEVDNYACQSLMDKVKAKLIDIDDCMFDTEEEAQEFEEKHLDEIDDKMIELAKKLEVEPRELLSHVLDYRIFVEKLEAM